MCVADAERIGHNLKNLYIAEKPSVVMEFADVLGVKGNAGNGYLESDTAVVKWCVGHLVTMSYPEVYDLNLKKWSLSTIPFIPTEYKYEVLPDTKKQFSIVAGLLTRDDIGCIYVATDSGREGEYIYRLVDSMVTLPARRNAVCGSIHRPRRRSSGESVRRSRSQSTTVSATQRTLGPGGLPYGYNF